MLGPTASRKNQAEAMVELRLQSVGRARTLLWLGKYQEALDVLDQVSRGPEVKLMASRFSELSASNPLLTFIRLFMFYF